MKLETEYIHIFHYCLYHLGNKEDAEDATQETFLRYLQHPEYQGCHERQYLYKIAKNLCVDTLRKTKTNMPYEDTVPSEETDIPTKTALKIALSELTAEEREMVILRFVNRENLTVIAKIFGISRFTASRRIHAITQTLKNKLREEQ